MPPVCRFMTYQPWTIRQDAPLARAHGMMREHQIRHLPVLAGGKLTGILSARDLAVFERARGSGGDTIVEDAMTQDVYTAEPDDPTDQVIDAMLAHKYGCAVILDRHGDIAGIFTAIDALQLLVEMLRRDERLAAG